MGRIIGIDLGTCNSAVVVPEPLTGRGFYNLPGYDGYTVVLDRFQRRIVPSVVAQDDTGKVIVGHAAKARAGLSPAPIMFAKRDMGEAKTFRLGDRDLTPTEVSAHVLRHLKRVAEEQLGEPVDEAVITVPAYFSLLAKQETEQAAVQAGLKVAQIAPEPVAAALTYCATDPRDPLQVMTYDLGGGTFDVAIVEKKNGRITIDSIKASDGNRFLGGYDFDKKLAAWMVAQLRAQNYDLVLDQQRAEDRVIFAKLMVYAERVKIELSKNTVCELVEPSTGIVDRAGTPISIELTVTREQFEAMIAPDIEESIAICHRALAQATPPVAPAQIHEILMVGGSSRIPLVARRLEAEFGRVPKLIEPDLCVAMGAGIIAGSLKSTRLGCGVELDPIPAETGLTAIVVTGRVAPAPGRSPAQCRVSLRAADGSYQREVAPKEEGRFLFDRVPLARGAQTDFVLTVSGPQPGVAVASHKFSVTQRAAQPGAPRNEGVRPHRPGIIDPRIITPGTRTNFLAKPILAVWYSGPESIAAARTPLPFSKVVSAKTTDLSGRIRIELREDNTPLGEILMENVPKTLPVGSEVAVTLNIGDNYVIEAEAYVPALAMKQAVRINLPPRPVKTLAQLERECAVLAAKVDDALRAAGPGALFANRTAMRLRERMAACQEKVRSSAADAPAIQDSLDEIEGLLRELSGAWNPDPSRDAFDALVAKAWRVHKEAVAEDPKIAQEGFDKKIEALVREAEAAYAKQDPDAWKLGCQRLEDQIGQLERKIHKPSQLPPPPLLKLQLLQGLVELETWARQEEANGKKGTFQAHAQELKEAAASLKAIDVTGPEPEAYNRLIHWFQTTFMDLHNRLHAPDGTGRVERMTRR
jgi:actin-like ATPase involved in cell morphogenesis